MLSDVCELQLVRCAGTELGAITGAGNVGCSASDSRISGSTVDSDRLVARFCPGGSVEASAKRPVFLSVPNLLDTSLIGTALQLCTRRSSAPSIQVITLLHFNHPPSVARCRSSPVTRESVSTRRRRGHPSGIVSLPEGESIGGPPTSANVYGTPNTDRHLNLSPERHIGAYAEGGQRAIFFLTDWPERGSQWTGAGPRSLARGA